MSLSLKPHYTHMKSETECCVSCNAALIENQTRLVIGDNRWTRQQLLVIFLILF